MMGNIEYSWHTLGLHFQGYFAARPQMDNKGWVHDCLQEKMNNVIFLDLLD